MVEQTTNGVEPDIKDGVVLRPLTPMQVVDAAVASDSPYYERALDYSAKRLQKVLGMESIVGVTIELPIKRSQMLFDDIRGHIAVLEVADQPDVAPKPEEKNGVYRSDPTKARKPNRDQEIAWDTRLDEQLREELRAEDPQIQPPVIVIFDNEKQEQAQEEGTEAQKEVIRTASDLLMATGYPKGRLRSRAYLERRAYERGIDISEKNFVIPEEHWLILYLDLIDSTG